jgi:hypothetical protein
LGMVARGMRADAEALRKGQRGGSGLTARSSADG